MWFEVFSGGAGIFAIGMVVFWLPSKYPDVTLTVFWGAVIVVIGGGWWLVVGFAVAKYAERPNMIRVTQRI